MKKKRTIIKATAGLMCGVKAASSGESSPLISNEMQGTI